MTRPIYMDYNATTPIRAQAARAMAAALQSGGNPSSVHRYGRMARRMIDEAREKIARAIGAAPTRVIFTAGATEANNLVLRGCGRRRLLISAIEHESIVAVAPDAVFLPVDRDGRADLAALDAALSETDQPALVALMAANNETGVIQPVTDAAKIAHRHGALLLVDAVQALGRIPVDMAALGADYLTVSAHKIGGPSGIGALALSPTAPLTAQILGGGQERSRRAGTENLSGITGFAAAIETLADDLADQPRLAALRDRLEDRVVQIAPSAEIFGRRAPRLSNTTCFALDGAGSESQVMALDLAGVAVSAGAACSSGRVRPSRVLTAMGVDPERAACAIRVSLGWQSQARDIDEFLTAWAPLAARLSSNRRHAGQAAE